jgi:hypothetical protein
MGEQRLTGVTTRRQFIGRGLSAAAVGTAITMSLPRSARAASGWPRASLRAGDATRVDQSQFMGPRQLEEWQGALDDLGLRATASSVHDGYIDSLAARLEQVGVQQIQKEPVPFTYWGPGELSLDVVDGPGIGPVRVAGYIPYSGQTPVGGVAAPLILAATGGTSEVQLPSPVVPNPSPASLQGQIVLFDVPPHPLANGVWDALDYGAPTEPHHPPGYSSATVYNRLWIAQPTGQLDALSDAKATGAIGILDLPADAAQGMYMPYDAQLRDLPALFVDRDAGAQLRQVAQAGGSVRLTLPASVGPITSPNLYGFIHGASDELVILQSHTDGTNGIEDNGPEAILAICQYLARLPKGALPRTILVVLSTGHFAAGDLGTSYFVENHLDDYIARTAAALTVEHLGALEWLPGADGEYQLTGRYELGGSFTSPYPMYVELMRTALARAGVTEDRVLRPWVPAVYTNTNDPMDSGGQPGGVSPDAATWPGDGESFWARGGLPASNFITGPAYLLNGGMRVAGMIDIHALRRQAMSFTQLLLDLTRAPLAQLQTRYPVG